MKRSSILLIIISIALFGEEYYENGTLQKLTPVSSPSSPMVTAAVTTSNAGGLRYYKTDNGFTMGVSDEIVIRVKEHRSINSIIADIPVSVVDSVDGGIYLLKVDSGQDPFSVSRIIFETGDVHSSAPNFVRERRRR